MNAHDIEGGGGLRLHVRDWGPPDAPAILFLHGWSQHHLCWSAQTASTLADTYRLIAMDLRGHGQSDAPLEAEAYSDGDLWADDVRNVIDALSLDGPLLVGWSYGGFVISDYVRRYGDDAIAGINFVGAAVGSGRDWVGSRIGAAFIDQVRPACSDDRAIAMEAMRSFLHACAEQPLPLDTFERAMDWTMLVHPKVRENLLRRTVDFTPVLETIAKPVLVTYGDADRIMLPAMAKTILDHVPNGRGSEYAGCGHLTFMEEPDRFNAELDAFARACFAAKGC